MTDENILDELARQREKKGRAASDESANADSIAQLVGRYAYITGMDRYYDTQTSTLLAKSAVDTSHRHELGRSASNKLVEAEAVEIVQGPTWVPNAPRFIVRGASRFLNVYQPPTETHTSGDVALYEELAEYLIPDKVIREHILDWFAFVIQQPERKPNWQVLLGGMEGIGKDALIYVLCRAVGFHNTVTIGPHDLESQFNDQFANKKLGILNEISAFRNPRLENSLKQYAADPPAEIAINPKGATRYSVPNLIALVGMTNHRSGFTVSRNDRRWLAYWSPAKPLPASYYDELWKFLEGDGGLHVWHWLSQRDLTQFNPKARAPDTEYKAELIEVSEDPTLAVLRECLEDRVAPFDDDLVLIDRVLRFLNDPRMDRGRVGGFMRELGCEGCRVQQKHEGGNSSKRFWIVRRHDAFKEMPSADLWKIVSSLRVD